MLRTNTQLHAQLKEKIGSIREEFWPRLLELAADHEKEQVRNLTILFMDLKGFSKWSEDELSEKLSLFRGLVKPILRKFTAGHPNMEGDSLRVTFTNATAGLSCACMIRNVLRAAGFELRIGMELGEVAVVHNEVTDVPDLEGVAVSMAARMEAAAEPGEVLVSHKIRHYAQRSGLFHFAPRRVPLKKAIGNIEQGDFIECFAVEAAKNVQDAIT
jgi:class 3 adenylate cyclase